MNRVEKQQAIERLKEKFSSAQIAVLADYKGLTVEQITELRTQLRESQSNTQVIKNSLAKIAISDVYSKGSDNDAADVEKLKALLEGPNLLTVSESDIVAPAKILTKFAKDNEQLSIKGAWLDGSFIDTKEIQALAKMPSKEELYGKLLNLLNAPATQMVQLLNAPASQFVRLLGAYRDKLDK